MMIEFYFLGELSLNTLGIKGIVKIQSAFNARQLNGSSKRQLNK